METQETSKNNKYQNGKIYKIYNIEEPEKIYVGSTYQPLSGRFRDHKKSYRSYLNGTGTHPSFYSYVNKYDYGWDNFRIELIEDCPCENREQLHRREGYWIQTLKATLNKFIAGRTKKQYRQDNKDTIKEHKKQYRRYNKDTIKERAKQYYHNNKDTIKEHIKQYYQNNKDKIKEYQQQYRQKRKDANLKTDTGV